MAQELVVRQPSEVGIMMPPEETLEFASRAAKALKQVISLKPNPVIMNGEQYLEMEDWELCGQFYGYTVRTHHAEPVEVDGVKGARAEADLVNINTGEVIGGAVAYCMRDEEHWSTRPRYEWLGEDKNRRRVKVGEDVVPWFQLASMAQTRAAAKAFRNRLAWVVVLAGYRPTPAEEMTEGTVSEAVQERRTVDKTSHYCSVHNANFFKKGRMKGFAHPIEGTDQWCNEPEPMLETPLETPGQARKPSEGKTNDNLPEEADEPAPQKPARDPSSIKSIEQLAKALKEDFGLSYADQWKELNISSWNDLAISTKEAYQQIASVRA